MKDLHIDFEVLDEIYQYDTKEDGEAYLDTESGEILFIPQNIINAIDDDDVESLGDWEMEIAKDALNIIDDEDERYLLIPEIDEEMTENIIKEFLSSLDEEESQKVVARINWDDLEHTFMSAMRKYEMIDDYYDFLDEQIKQFVIEWLEENGINCI